MPFGLTNAGVTYQQFMNTIFDKHRGKKIEVYIDDMVVKSKIQQGHGQDLKEIFETLDRFNVRLNPLKCSFRLRSRVFLGYLMTRRGIEANPS